MKQLVYIFVSIILLLSALGLSAQSFHPHYEDGSFYWRLKPGNTPMLDDSVLIQFGVTKAESPFAVLNPKKLKGGSIIDVLHRTYRLRFTNVGSTTAFRNYLLQLPETDLVESIPLAMIDYTPNDPQLASQWNLTQIDAANAWNLTFGNPTVTVAIVDDAVLTSHQDLAPSIWVNPGEIPNNGVDDDLNGYIDDVNGYDVADGDNNASPAGVSSSSVFTHGTHCAGIAGAATDNGIGIASIGFGIKIIPVKCNSNSTPGPSLPAAYDGVTYAISVLPDVMSLSWGGPGSSSTNQLLFDLAYTNDIVVVAAAGNSNVVTPMYPASYNHVISVAATDLGDIKASFSNFGPTVDVSAPGVNIQSTLAGNNADYGQLSGTSMATPLVAGLCGLMRSFNPNRTVDQIETCLKSTADPIDLLNPGFAGQLGTGRINAFNAVQCVTGTPIALFTQNNVNICPGFAVQFTDQSFGSPTSWSWTFPGGVPATSTLQNPLVTYAAPGSYPVTLTVSNIQGSNSLTFNNIVVALPTATLSGGGLINVGSPALLTVVFTGAAPYSFTYTDGSTNFTINNINASSHSFAVSPSVTTTYSLVSMSNAQCSGTVSGTALVTVSNGCGATINFQQIIGGARMDNPYNVKQTPDCGYIVSGSTFSYGTGLFDAVLTRLDDSGNILWFRTYGNATDDSYFADVVPVATGFVAFGGRGANNQSRFMVVKTDQNGNVIWQQHLQYTSGGGAISASPGQLVEMPNGDIVIGYGTSHSNFNSTGQGMARLNGTTGALIWARNNQVNNFEWGTGVEATAGNGVVGAAYSRSTGVGSGLYDMSLTERDALGNVIWSRNYGSTANEFAMDLVRLPDQGYLVVGYTQSFASSVYDIVVMRTDSNGVLSWARKYARPAADIGLKIAAGCNGKYYVAGSSRTPNNGNDALLFQIDLNGNVLWSKAIGGPLNDGDYIGLSRTGDCGCVLSTSTLSFGVGDNDMMIVKTDSLGNFSCHATDVVLNVTNITPGVFAANPPASNAPVVQTILTTVQNHTPETPVDVCDACGFPVANFDYVTNAFSLACIDYSVNGQNWYWNFGDGSPIDTMQNAVHEYTAPGTYTVTLIVTSPCGADTISKLVTITGLNECKHVYQPGPENGVDSYVFSRPDATNDNAGSAGVFWIGTWTWSGELGSTRSYLNFDLSRICNSATLLDGRLSTNYNTIFGQPHSGTNNAWLRRCTTPWDEFAVTWQSQPAVSLVNQIAVPVLAGATNLTNFAVTPLIQDMITGPNYGFQWRNDVEGTYRRTMWCSSDWANPVERPKLELTFAPIFAYAQALPSGSHAVTICRGDSIQLNLAGYTNSSTTSGPSIATGYLWVPSEGLSCATCPNPMASPDSTITYRAVAYNCPSCADIDSIRVTVSQVYVEAPDQILCAGDSIQMQAFHPVPNTNFIWTPTNTLSPANVQFPYAFPVVPTWYYVTATDNVNGCVSTDSAYVLTGYPSTLPPLINDTLIPCNQGTITFPLNPNFTPIGSDFYEWNLLPNITPDPNSPSSDAIINTNIFPATYPFELTVTNEFGCVTRDSVLVTVDCIVLPTKPVALTGSLVESGNLLEWIAEAEHGYQAMDLQHSTEGSVFVSLTTEAVLPNDPFAREFNYLHAAPTLGDHFYRLQLVDAEGALSYSETVLLHRSSGFSVAVYPNPSQGILHVNAIGTPDQTSIRMFNAIGQEVLNLGIMAGHEMDLDCSALPKGTYLLEFKTADSATRMKVILR